MEKPHETGEITDTAAIGLRCSDLFSLSSLVYFFYRLGCWFNILKRPKSRQHGPLSTNGAGHNATSKATDTQWHWLMADCRPGVSWPLRLDLYTPSHWQIIWADLHDRLMRLAHISPLIVGRGNRGWMRLTLLPLALHIHIWKLPVQPVSRGYWPCSRAPQQFY